ncbi:MAG: hypothetical protein PUJ79_05070 [Helicobacter sp.]|uniref:hypothetical protein n=1 Tax=Helicobacter sp. 10-6591 TaxID=2004998 RepID=UPI000DCD4BC6|nr:hypothetical protein [Helicobacter sp. 10-6591]MCI7485658.1 hypothetical protein [Helicobacter sp.]MDD7567756.1 hypothetical protein [Helicobacter sp.]MDY5740886.1 hypothetical protein [Helicobacter sp.]RAX54590.1 hypothetical protein CCY97_05590 [Helicobacter sp. 10-6591]
MQNTDTQKWLDKLKVALLSHDETTAFELSQNLPEGLSQDSLESQLQAKELLSQVIELLEKCKEESKQKLEQIKAAKAFLQN